MHQFNKLISLILFSTCIAYSPSSYSDQEVWEKLRQGGHVIVMRHTTADKSANNALVLKIGDCSVQRTLSPFGRKEATQIGNAFRDHSIPIAEVLASEYCRTQDTAKLAFKNVTSWPQLNLLNALPEQDQETRTTIVSKRITEYRSDKNLVLVTHQPNITALTFEVVKPGEMLVLKPDHTGEYDIVGRLTPDDLANQ